MKKVSLFIPCYVDQFYPQVGRATLALLEKLGCSVDYPSAQTCCGQPMANAGFESKAKDAYAHFVDTFAGSDYIVAPSGSCTYHVNKHYDIIPQTHEVKQVRANTYDLVAFLTDVLGVQELDASFPYRVGVHQSCHGQRGLLLARPSEIVGTPFSKVHTLLSLVKGIELVPLKRADECCGFGGTFAINEAAISVKMGKDRINDHLSNHAEYITAGDMSCLMHLEGIIRRKKLPIRVKHIAEILNGEV